MTRTFVNLPETMKTKQSQAPVNKQALGHLVKKAIAQNAEQKGLQFLQSGATAATGVVASLNAMNQGDTVSTRTGTVIQPATLDVMLESVVGAYIDAVRYIIFYDRKANGTNPTSSDVLSSDFIGANYNFLNVVQNKRFHILLDETHSLNGNGVAFALTHKTITGMPKCYYSGTSSADSSLSTNALFSLVIGYSTHVGYSIDTQLRFTDV
jgi:hypothetical protein